MSINVQHVRGFRKKWEKRFGEEHDRESSNREICLRAFSF